MAPSEDPVIGSTAAPPDGEPVLVVTQNGLCARKIHHRDIHPRSCERAPGPEPTIHSQYGERMVVSVIHAKVRTVSAQIGQCALRCTPEWQVSPTSSAGTFTW